MEEWKYKPARDLQLSLSDRLRSIQREGGFVSAAIRFIWWHGVTWYLRLFHRLNIEGQEHLPPQPPFVIVANHSSHLDALTVGASLPSRLRHHMYPLAAGDTFFEKLPRATFAALCLNAIPIWRKKLNVHDMDDLRSRLVDEGCVYILFPEGTRSRDGKMGSFKRGVGYLLAKTDIPVIPAYIRGTFEALAPGKILMNFSSIGITFGAALTFEQLERNRDGTKVLAHSLEESVKQLGKGQAQ